MIKITLVCEVTDGGWDFATTEEPEIESDLKKDALHLVGVENACFIASKGKL